MKRIIFACLGLAVICSDAKASSLTLTADGVADGFTLTTFISGYSAADYGPLAQGISNGNVITGSARGSAGTNIYVLPDVDGQTLASAISTVPYACQTGNCNYAMTTAGGKVYGAQAFGGTYQQFSSNGTPTALTLTGPDGSITSNLGMWGNPVNGHIISSSSVGLVDINPVTGSYTVIVAGLFPDGVSVSPDGTKAIVEVGGSIQIYDIASHTLLHSYPVGHSPDGTGVITGGLFNGFIVVNNNDGTVGLLNPTTGVEDIIASGGNRGDFVSPDTTNGTLFLSQEDAIDRLSCGPGCSIGVGGVPEPSTWAMIILGFLGLGLMAYRKKNTLRFA